MQHLPLPVTAAADEAEVNKLAKQAYWQPHQAAWIATYQTYQANAGSPFALIAHDFGPGVGERQYALYDNRKKSGELKRMRKKAGLKSCPICGSPVTGSLDHYLPRDLYREFSIMRANLVPACMHCNSSTKGTIVHGGEPRRFIHPYYDAWAGDVLWFVEIVPPYKAVTFKPRPMPQLPEPRDQIVAFHLDNVLGTQFELSMATYWSSLPGQIKLRDPELAVASVTAQLQQELRVALHAGGANCWLAALLRGILISPGSIEHLRQEAIAFQLPPMPPAP
jgi:5-methylcytosine-specific restriction endonuclease McrA